MLCAATAVGFDEVVEVVFSVVVGKLFAGFDCAFGEDEDFSALHFYLAVWTAGVVDVARDVLSCGSVDGLAVTDFKKILSRNTIRFVFCDDIAPVLNDESAFGNGNVGKHA